MEFSRNYITPEIGQVVTNLDLVGTSPEVTPGTGLPFIPAD